jgi:hypothetical protein
MEYSDLGMVSTGSQEHCSHKVFYDCIWAMLQHQDWKSDESEPGQTIITHVALYYKEVPDDIQEAVMKLQKLEYINQGMTLTGRQEQGEPAIPNEFWNTFTLSCTADCKRVNWAASFWSLIFSDTIKS